MAFEIGEIERAIYAKVVQKCGNRRHWEDWANDVARIAKTHITRIRTIVETPSNIEEIATFQAFAQELRDNLNDAITDDEIIIMLAQHLITKPVFDALFEGYSFAQRNPISISMQSVLNILEKHRLEKETDTLEPFYKSVKLRAQGIDSSAAKQRITSELYDKFFKNAFPRMTDKLGIVYTPVPVVDFIIHSINDALQSEFGKTLGDEDVHIIDPFTGTGTFITRLLQSGLIAPEQLAHKYKKEIHANEIVLLAYYIATINIESVYHDLMGGDYLPFEGICLTDTFELYEKEDLGSKLLADNNSRRKRQKELKLTVIMGNPPYSAGQDNANDDNQNIDYPFLDNRITESYVQKSSKKMGKSKAYDSYIRAIRWASDRLAGDDGSGCGVMGFVINAGWINTNTADGLRKCLAEEFASIYVFHLRGNANLSGEQRRKEKDNVFDSGTKTPVAITILVRNPKATEHGRIVMHDIGDYLTREEKLGKITEFKSINGISAANGWQPINPDKHGDWVNQRDDSFGLFISLGNKAEKGSKQIFASYSMGIKTNRDEWVYNFSKRTLENTVNKMLEFYNQERIKVLPFNGSEKIKQLNRDKSKIKWTTDIEKDLCKNREHKFEPYDVVVCLYRPFTKMRVYANANWNWTRHLMPQYFPNVRPENRVISLVGTGTPKAFSAIMTDELPDVQLQANAQCFPEHIYDTDVAEASNIILTEPLQLGNRVICLTTTGAKGFSVLMTDAVPDLHLIGDAQCFPLYLYEMEGGK